MDERPMEDASKAEVSRETPKDKPNRGLSGVKSLIALVACSGAVFWAWSTVREGMRPSLGWARKLHSGDIDDRQIAARQLGECSPADLEVAVPALIAASGEANELVRAAAVSALGSAGVTAIKAKAKEAEAKDAGLALTKALSDDAAEVRLSAAEALRELATAAKPGGFPSDPDAVASAIVRLLEDPSLVIRKRAEFALDRFAAATSIRPPAPLVDGLGRWTGHDARASAATALGSFKTGGDAAVPALVKALKDKEPDVRSNAAASLQKFGPDAAPALPSLIANVDDPFVPAPPPDHRVPVAQSLAGRGVVASDIDLATDPAVEAIKAIGAIAGSRAGKGETPSPEVVEALVKSYRSGRPAIWVAAGEALRRLGKGASAAIPDLIKDLAGLIPQTEDGKGESVAFTLGAIAPGTESAPQAIAAFVSALDAKALSTRIAAMNALGKFGPAASEALPRLRELGGGEDKGLASVANAAGDLVEGKVQPDAPRRKNAGGGRGGRGGR